MSKCSIIVGGTVSDRQVRCTMGLGLCQYTEREVGRYDVSDFNVSKVLPIYAAAVMAIWRIALVRVPRKCNRLHFHGTYLLAFLQALWCLLCNKRGTSRRVMNRIYAAYRNYKTGWNCKDKNNVFKCIVKTRGISTAAHIAESLHTTVRAFDFH
jgi:hypothetical protein